MYAEIYFFPVNFNRAWRFDADAYLLTANTQNTDFNVIAYLQSLATAPCEYQHSNVLICLFAGALV